jgi:hypothetical protein
MVDDIDDTGQIDNDSFNRVFDNFEIVINCVRKSSLRQTFI